jgi:hypothetical protein
MGPTGAFEAPVALASTNTDGSESNPVISADGLTIYLSREPLGLANNSSLYLARRSTVNDGFGDAFALSELNSDHIYSATRTRL